MTPEVDSGGDDSARAAVDPILERRVKIDAEVRRELELYAASSRSRSPGYGARLADAIEDALRDARTCERPGLEAVQRQTIESWIAESDVEHNRILGRTLLEVVDARNSLRILVEQCMRDGRVSLAHAIRVALRALDELMPRPIDQTAVKIARHDISRYLGLLERGGAESDAEAARTGGGDLVTAVRALLEALDRERLVASEVRSALGADERDERDEESVQEPTPPEDPDDVSFEHEVRLELASGARLTILYFSDREIRWIFSHRYVGEKQPGRAPEIVNDVRLVADYADGLLTARFTLSMYVVVPARLGRQFFAGADVSPGGKTYLEFEYERTGTEYRLVEIRRGARDRVRLGSIPPALLRQVEFPFLVPDRISAEGQVRVPFLRDAGDVGHFELPTSTLRGPGPGRPDAAPGVLEEGRPE